MFSLVYDYDFFVHVNGRCPDADDNADVDADSVMIDVDDICLCKNRSVLMEW